MAPKESIDKTVTFRYMGEALTVNVKARDNIRSLWSKVANDLGANPDTPVTFHAGGTLLRGSDAPDLGAEIEVATKHDDKATD